ncbi:outer membrane protein assembly factor BamC [Orrella sp. 11846]|uniref:outer membrane protein assembly factor BamC n=1 Tax=Orrella sp. 11846 TaxID=3409913 RepID=UPI003B58F010
MAGCQSLKDTLSGDNAIDYKSTVRTDPLSIPPDLTQAAADPRYRAPSTGVTSLSQYQSQQANADAEVRQNVLPEYPGIEVKRDGDLRWLVVDASPDTLFPKVQEFWYDNGFNLDVNDPKAGLMVTNWAENRAKIPESWIRQIIGTVLDSVYDSGERDKFRTIFERDGQKTLIFISHEHMVEVRVGIEADQTRWEVGREDPGLNAAMIARLMVYLGDNEEEARRKMAQAQEQNLKPTVIDQVRSDGSIVVEEGFDQTWRRVGLALDSGNFAVEDRDRSSGDFFVRYVDADTGVKREEPSIFARMFGAKKLEPAQLYRLHLSADGPNTVIRVYNEQGAVETSATGTRILEVLAERL